MDLCVSKSPHLLTVCLLEPAHSESLLGALLLSFFNAESWKAGEAERVGHNLCLNANVWRCTFHWSEMAQNTEKLWLPMNSEEVMWLLTRDPCFPLVTKYNYNICILLTLFFFLSFFFIFFPPGTVTSSYNENPHIHLAGLTLAKEVFMHCFKY